MPTLTVTCAVRGCPSTATEEGVTIMECDVALFHRGWRPYKAMHVCPQCITAHAPDATKVYGPKLLTALKALEPQMVEIPPKPVDALSVASGGK